MAQPIGVTGPPRTSRVPSTVDRMSLEEYAEHTRQHIVELEALLAMGDGTTPSLRPDPPTTLDVALDLAELFSNAGGLGATVLKSLVRRGAGKYLLGQASVKSTFAHGPHAGRTIGEVAQGLRAGTISADTLPIDYVIRNGQAIALNNRSLLALTRAGMQPTVTRNLTGNQAAEALLNSHLQGGVPSTVIRVRGGPPGTSLIE